MRDGTRALLSAFEDLDWFHAVGKPIQKGDIVHVTRWLDAVGHLTSGWYEMLGYREGTSMQDAVEQSGKGMTQRWKEAEKELRPLARQVVMEKVREIREQRRWTVMLDMIVDYDVSCALLEREFEDVLNAGFFGLKAYWYLQGHLPCGVSPDDKLIVY